MKAEPHPLATVGRSGGHAPLGRALQLTLWIAALVLAPGCVSGEKPPGYEHAAREARLNAESTPNHLYEQAVWRRLRNPLERAARSCSTRIADARPVKILLRLDAAGAPTEILVYPDAKFGQCVYGEIREVPLPPPPRPDYWIAVDVPSTSPTPVRVPSAMH